MAKLTEHRKFQLLTIVADEDFVHWKDPRMENLVGELVRQGLLKEDFSSGYKAILTETGKEFASTVF